MGGGGRAGKEGRKEVSPHASLIGDKDRDCLAVGQTFHNMNRMDEPRPQCTCV